MLKRIMVCFVTVMMAVMPVQVQAEDLNGRVTSLSLGEEAPYAGVLLDPIAASKMIVDEKYLRSEIELELRKEFQEELSSKRLAHDLLRVDYLSLQRVHEETLSLKNKQINDLNLILKDQSSNHSQWFALGGATIGVLLSIAVFYASVEVVK